MKTNRTLIVTALLLVATAFMSCSDDKSLTADEQAIVDEITTDADEIYGVDIVNEDDPSGFGKTGGLSKVSVAIDPERYGRRAKPRFRDISIDVSEDGLTATATIQFSLVGQFVLGDVVEGTNQVNLYFKPFRHTLTRKVQFAKVADSTEADGFRWQRTGITPAYGVSDNGTLSLTGNVTIRVTDSTTDEVTEWTISDPLNYYFAAGNDIPRVHPGDRVHIEVGIANSGSDGDPYGIVHRGKRSRFPGEKESFHDDGLNGDATADDGIYTIEWTVLPMLNDAGFHIGVLDFFSSNTIFESDATAGPYNSLMVALPYSKQPR